MSESDSATENYELEDEEEDIVNASEEEDIVNASEDDEDKQETIKKPVKKDKTGVLYIQTVPPLYTVSKMREVMSTYGEAEKVGHGGKKRKKYTEGWVEFKKKSVAKRVAGILNGSMVGGKRRSMAYDTLWAIKYLNRFKWAHLMEQLTYERKVEENRLRAEISQARRQAEHFADQVEKGANLRRLEENVLKKGGLWERYQRQIQQRTIVKEARKTKSAEVNKSNQFLQMIFDAK